MRKLMVKYAATLAFVLLTIALQAQTACSNKLPPKNLWGQGGRPATECERIFYRVLYPKLLAAMQGVAGFAENGNWQAVSPLPDPNLGMVNFFGTIDSAWNLSVMTPYDGGFFAMNKYTYPYTWAYQKSLQDEGLASLYDKAKPAIDSAQSFLLENMGKISPADMGKSPLLCRAAMQKNEVESKTHFTVLLTDINVAEDKLDVAGAALEQVNVAGCSYALRIIKNKMITDTQAPGESDAGCHLDELHLYIGKWAAPQVAPGKGFITRNSFNATQTKLSVQNMLIVIKCNASLFDALVQSIALNELESLVLK